jgi:light-regulated signal transduction histidine kinase (bacteriophytochrome)
LSFTQRGKFAPFQGSTPGIEQITEPCFGVLRTEAVDHGLASLLHFAGVGRGPIEHRDVDLGSVVFEAIEMLGARLDERFVSVVIDSPLAHVLGDAANLRFVNLLSNAAKCNDKSDR